MIFIVAWTDCDGVLYYLCNDGYFRPAVFSHIGTYPWCVKEYKKKGFASRRTKWPRSKPDLQNGSPSRKFVVGVNRQSDYFDKVTTLAKLLEYPDKQEL